MLLVPTQPITCEEKEWNGKIRDYITAIEHVEMAIRSPICRRKGTQNVTNPCCDQPQSHYVVTLVPEIEPRSDADNELWSGERIPVLFCSLLSPLRSSLTPIPGSILFEEKGEKKNFWGQGSMRSAWRQISERFLRECDHNCMTATQSVGCCRDI